MARGNVGRTATVSDVHCKWPLLLLFRSPVAFRDFNTIINPRTNQNPPSHRTDTRCLRSPTRTSRLRTVYASRYRRNEYLSLNAQRRFFCSLRLLCARARSRVCVCVCACYCSRDIVRVCVCVYTNSVPDVQSRPLDSTTARNMYVTRVRRNVCRMRVRTRTGRFDGSPVAAVRTCVCVCVCVHRDVPPLPSPVQNGGRDDPVNGGHGRGRIFGRYVRRRTRTQSPRGHRIPPHDERLPRRLRRGQRCFYYYGRGVTVLSLSPPITTGDEGHEG